MRKAVFALVLLIMFAPTPVFAVRNLADIYTEDGSDISEWTDGDNLGGETTATTFDSASVVKLDSGATPQNNARARIDYDCGTIDDVFAISFRIYFENIGTIAAEDDASIQANNGSMYLVVEFDTNGMWVYDGAAWNQVAAISISEDTWYKVDILVDASTPASATCDVWIDNVLEASGEDCSYDTAGTDGFLRLQQKGETNANQITYIDYLEVGSGMSTRRIMTVM